MRSSVATIIISIFINCCICPAQNPVTGKVLDASNDTGLQYVMVYFEGTQIGCITDEQGNFILDNAEGHKTVKFELMGYETQTVEINPGSIRKLNVSLKPQDERLNAAVIKPKKVKYSRRENPAVDLMREVIAHKKQNTPEGRDCYHVEEYDKLTLSLNEYTPDFNKVKKLSFTESYVDTSELSGSPVLTLSVRERLSDTYFRNHPRAEKHIVKAKRHKGYDEELDPNGGLTANLEVLFQNVDIYKADIEIFTQHFTGPLAGELAIAYYKYYISDTVKVNGAACTEISFVPENPESFGFTGKLYIATDSTYALRKAVLNTPARINLNWVDNFRLDQEFSPIEDGTYMTSKVDAQMNLSLNGNKPSVYARKMATYRNYEFNIPEDIFDSGDNSGVNSIDLPEAGTKDDEYWNQNRHVILKESESRVGDLAKGLMSVPFINFATKVSDVIITDFAPTKYPKEKSKIDIGNVSNIIGKNSVEGWRIRVGAQTKAALNSHLFAKGYLAYGTGDGKLKHSAELVYSFNKMNNHPDERPRNRIVFKHEYDLYSAEEQEFRDNIFFSFKTGERTTYMQYIQTGSLSYEKEWDNGLSLTGSIEYKNFKPAGDLEYILADSPSVKLPEFNVMPLSANLRYAPGEKRFQSQKQNGNVAKNVPIFNLSHTFAPDALLGSDFGYNRTDFQFWKRTWLSVAGVVDTKVKAGCIWNSGVPYPLLIIPATTQSIMFQKEAFHLMKPFEFVCDKYVSLNLTYRMKGLILNRIPLIKKLKWREVIIFDTIYGGLSDGNNPAISKAGLFEMPQNTRALGKEPYMELGFGLENIFKVFHVYYIMRMNYLDTPGCERRTVRAGIHLDF